MGLSQYGAVERDQRLTPTLAVVEKAAERGHKRGQTVVDHRRGGDAGLRGVPVIGIGAGAISGTAPGGELGAARRLEQAGRDLVRQHRNRFKART